MAETKASSLSSRIAAGVANLFPGYFALVMATGIVSMASFLLGMGSIAWTLFAIAVAS